MKTTQKALKGILIVLVSLSSTAWPDDLRDHAFDKAQDEFIEEASRTRAIAQSDPAQVFSKLEADFFSQGAKAYGGVPIASSNPPHGLLCATRNRLFAAVLCAQPQTAMGTTAPFIRVIPDLEKEPEFYRKRSQENLDLAEAYKKLQKQSDTPEFSKYRYILPSQVAKLSPAEKETHSKFMALKKREDELGQKLRANKGVGEEAYAKCYQVEKILVKPLSTESSPIYQWDRDVREIEHPSKSSRKKVDFFSSWVTDPAASDTPRISKAYSVVRDKSMILRVPVKLQDKEETAMCLSAPFVTPRSF